MPNRVFQHPVRSTISFLVDSNKKRPCNEQGLFQKRTQGRTQNVVPVMLLMTLISEKNEENQACWGGMETLSRWKPGFKPPWDYQLYFNIGILCFLSEKLDWPITYEFVFQTPSPNNLPNNSLITGNTNR